MKVAKVANSCMKEGGGGRRGGIDVSYRSWHEPENYGLISLEECIFQSHEEQTWKHLDVNSANSFWLFQKATNCSNEISFEGVPCGRSCLLEIW